MSIQRDQQYMSVAKSVMNVLKTSLRVSKAAVGGSYARQNQHATSDIDIIYAVQNDPPKKETVSKALKALQDNLAEYKPKPHPSNPRVVKIKVPNLGPGDVVYKSSSGFDQELNSNKNYRRVNL